MAEQFNSPRARQTLQWLESLHAAGIQQLPKPSPVRRIVTPSAAESTTMANLPQPPELIESHESPPLKVIASKPSMAESVVLFQTAEVPPTEEIATAATLEILSTEVAACAKCHELATTRTQTVFGVGNSQARLVFLGEAPGADEDRQGEPFVGRGGQLLNKILVACHLGREEVYILNVIKCRPPGNRNPTPGEAENCRPYLLRQLELIQPEFICCLGAVAAQNLLRTSESIGKLRGKVHDYHGIKVVCTYHPAYLLRNPSAKKYTWDDMKFLMREMGQPVD